MGWSLHGDISVDSCIALDADGAVLADGDVGLAHLFSGRRLVSAMSVSCDHSFGHHP